MSIDAAVMELPREYAQAPAAPLAESVRPEWLSPEAEPEWDAFVGRHPFGHVYHLSAWNRVLHEAFSHIRGRFLVLRDADGAIQSGLPAYIVKSWLLGTRISSVPFATVCDPLVSSAYEFACLFAEVEALRRRRHARTIEIRANRTAPLIDVPELAGRSHYKHHYLSLDVDPQTLFESFSKSSVRQKALKASREGVSVEEGNGENALRACYDIMRQTRSRLSLPVLPCAFFDALYRSMWPAHLRLFLAVHHGKPIACHIVLRFKQTWISEFSGNTDDAHVGANQLLYWNTIERAQADGARIFSFGRTSASNEGLLSYKRRWNPVEEDLYDFTLRSNAGPEAGRAQAREHSAPYRAVRSLLARAPRPLHEAIGAYCYRHLG